MHRRASHFTAFYLLLISTNALAFLPQAGPWFNPDKNGRGLDLQLVADFRRTGPPTLVLTWYSYRSNGSPIWYQAVATLADHDWTADLREFHWDTSQAASTSVGQASLHFYDQRSARFDWQLGEIGRAHV